MKRLVAVTALLLGINGCGSNQPLDLGGGSGGTPGMGGGSAGTGGGSTGTGGTSPGSGGAGGSPSTGCTPDSCKNQPVPAIGCASGGAPQFVCQRAADGQCRWSAPMCPEPTPGADGGAGTVTCGARTCPAGQYCCNASCGICAPRGAACIQIACAPDAGAATGVCRSDADCRLFDDYCTACECRALAKTDPDPKCAGPGVRCLAAPCMNKTAACESGRCVVRAGTATAPHWSFTCGDPVCGGWRAKADVPLCTTQKAGDPCATAGERCDPKDNCNRLLQCSTTDPRPGMCPISRRETKRDIRYLSPEELRRYHDELLQLRLATWRYKQDPARERLGFIIDDHEQSVAVDAPRDTIDLYGYTSLAVATLQLQAREIADLRARLGDLERRLTARKRTSR